ncbi:hypothetical protein HOD75_03585 [archaeon]|jgi:hypothetical protein|nr:hypothetical protein [archaeon]MBT4241954.1 hypothetical protein [archaeon]MBT4418501.1 hypothetical protein [archaeon]
MKILMFLILFLFIGGFFIISNENIPLNNAENIGLFFELYAGWFDNLLDNGKSISGYFVKMEWLPETGVEE